MLKLLVIAALLLGPPSPTLGSVALSVSPAFVTLSDASKGKVKATITIPPDDRNRLACLIWEGESEQGSHCWEHQDVNDFPTHIEYPVRLHTLGAYQFQLVLQRQDREIRTPVQEIEVH